MKKFLFTLLAALISLGSAAQKPIESDHSKKYDTNEDITLRGDVNIDGKVSIADVAALIDYLIYNQWPDGEDTLASVAPSILIIGNSFSFDSFLYLPFILKSYNINIKLGIWYSAGAGLYSHVVNYASQPSGKRGFYYIDTANDTAWWTVSNVLCVQDAVKYDNWDVVTLQQNSSECYNWVSYGSNTTNLMTLILADATNEDMQFAWNINHTRQNVDYPTDVLANIRDITTQKNISIVFPYGTAIFNARNNETLATIGDGTNLWCGDCQHLQEGLSCYIAALANVQTIFDTWFPSKNLSVIGDTNRTNAEWTSGKGFIDAQGTNIGITDTNCMLAQQCAFDAARDKFTIQGGWDLLLVANSGNFTLEVNSEWEEVIPGEKYTASATNTPPLSVIITPNEGTTLLKCISRSLRNSGENSVFIPDDEGVITFTKSEITEDWYLYIITE